MAAKVDAEDATGLHVLRPVSSDWSAPGEHEPAPTHSDLRELRPRHTYQALIALLREVSLFASLDEPELEELAQAASVTEFERGGQIVRQGDPGGSLLVIESGFVELFVERSGAEPVRLATYGRGDFFGELSLFDGKPRSASAQAVTHVRIVEIRREAVMAKLSLEMMTGMLSAVASRVRKTDAQVSELAERITRAAHSNAHAAVAVELDAVKTLYQRTEHLAADTLDRAEKRSALILEQADAAVLRVKAQFDSERAKLTRIATIAGWALGLFGLGGIGWATAVFKAGEDVRKQDEAAKIASAEIAKVRRRVNDVDRSLRIVKETMTDLRAARDAAGLGHRVAAAPELRRIALNYEEAKRSVMQRYLAGSSDSTQDAVFEPEVVLEAAYTYLTLVSEGRGDRQLVLSDAERQALSDALMSVLERVTRAPADAIHGQQPSWALQRQLSNTWRWLEPTLSSRDRSALRLRLTALMRDGQAGLAAREHAALTFVALGGGLQGDAHTESTVRELLKNAMRRSADWMSMQSAFALAKLGDRGAWQQLKTRLHRADTRELAVDALAQEGAEGVKQLAQKMRDDPREILAELQKALEAEVTTAPNCFAQRYARWLLQCTQGDCAQTTHDGELGGDCDDPPAGL